MNAPMRIARNELEVNILNGYFAQGLMSQAEWERATSPFIKCQIQENREEDEELVEEEFHGCGGSYVL